MTPPLPPQDPGHEALAEALQVSFRLLRAVMVLLLGLYALSGIFVVKQDEKALVLLFGKIAGRPGEQIKGPGIHWTWPRPIGEIVRVKTEQVQSLETGTFALAPTAPNQPPPGGDSPLRPGHDGYSLTGDANLMHSRWAVRYQVDDPQVAQFRFADLPAVLHRELDHAIQHASSRFAIDRALRTDLEAFRAAVADEVVRRSQQLGLGIRIVGVELLFVAPPRQVAEAFNQVIAAEQERSENISAARSYATRTVNEAEGQAARLLAEAAAYQRRIVSEVSADADYFNKVYAEYVKNPAVIARTLRQDSVRRALENAAEKFLLPEGGRQQQLRLLINREPKSPWLEDRE
jgi:membrane protease subunit HflK